MDAGRFFVLHMAYDRIGTMDVGSAEIIGYDAASGHYRTHFFDSQGNVSSQELTVRGERGGTWKWGRERARCTAISSDHGKTQSAHHDRLDEHGNWLPSMEVVLTKVE